ALRARFRPRRRDLRALWRLGREIALRPEIHGDRARDLPDRRQGQNSQGVAQGQGRRPRRRSSRCRKGAVSPLAKPSYPPTLASAAQAVLETADPRAKAALSRAIADDWRSGALMDIGQATPPDRPARPERPELLAPRHMPRRRANSEAGRAALL